MNKTVQEAERSLEMLREKGAPVGEELDRIREEVERAENVPTIWPWRKDIVVLEQRLYQTKINRLP
jgi:hypothetical protein